MQGKNLRGPCLLGAGGSAAGEAPKKFEPISWPLILPASLCTKKLVYKGSIDFKADKLKGYFMMEVCLPSFNRGKGVVAKAKAHVKDTQAWLGYWLLKPLGESGSSNVEKIRLSISPDFGVIALSVNGMNQRKATVVCSYWLWIGFLGTHDLGVLPKFLWGIRLADHDTPRGSPCKFATCASLGPLPRWPTVGFIYILITIYEYI